MPRKDTQEGTQGKYRVTWYDGTPMIHFTVYGLANALKKAAVMRMVHPDVRVSLVVEE